MFFNTPKPKLATDVDGILEEGRNWVNRLAIASKETATKADAITKHIIHLEIQRDNLQATAHEGTTIAENFKTLLHPKKL